MNNMIEPMAPQKKTCSRTSSVSIDKLDHRLLPSVAKGCHGSPPANVTAMVDPSKREPTWNKMNRPTIVESRLMPNEALGCSTTFLLKAKILRPLVKRRINIATMPTSTPIVRRSANRR